MGFGAKLLYEVEYVPRFVFFMQAPHIPGNHMDFSHGLHTLLLVVSLFPPTGPLTLLLVGFAYQGAGTIRVLGSAHERSQVFSPLIQPSRVVARGGSGGEDQGGENHDEYPGRNEVRVS